MTDIETLRATLEIMAAKSKGQPFCWKCGGLGYWHEQINGPHNLWTVNCDNPIHDQLSTSNV